MLCPTTTRCLPGVAYVAELLDISERHYALQVAADPAHRGADRGTADQRGSSAGRFIAVTVTRLELLAMWPAPPAPVRRSTFAAWFAVLQEINLAPLVA
jgi:hypothetical protein